VGKTTADKEGHEREVTNKKMSLESSCGKIDRSLKRGKRMKIPSRRWERIKGNWRKVLKTSTREIARQVTIRTRAGIRRRANISSEEIFKNRDK